MKLGQVQRLIGSGVFAQVTARELEQGDGGLPAFFLNMNKCAGELDQPFKKEVVGGAALLQPKLLQYFVCFEEKPLIKTFKEAKIMRIELASVEGMDD